MRRIERRLFAIDDAIEELRRDGLLVEAELSFHQHLNDDAQRDAIVSSHPMDRADARQTESDVKRFQRNLEQIRQRLVSLQAKRDRLIKNL